MYFVYVIESLINNSYYTGQTADIVKRIKRHNEGKNLSTKSYRPWRLKWWKEYNTRSEAVIIERKLKGIKKRIGIERFVEINNFRGVAQPG
jgi:putative endonuclease